MSEQQDINSPLASPSHRLGAVAVDQGLMIVTLYVGWIVWNLVTWAKGQSPGKNLLKIRVLDETSRKPASWGQMAVRQLLIPLSLAIPYYLAWTIFLVRNSGSFDFATFLPAIACGGVYLAFLIVDIVWVFGKTHRRLIDYLSGTIVVNEANSSAAVRGE